MTSTPSVQDGPAAPRPLRRDAVRNRELLVAAAGEVFAERGLDATLDEVARRAGLGVGTAYRHFANKRELASAVMESRMDAVVSAVEDAQEAPDPLAALVSFLEVAMAAQAGDRGLRQVLLGVHDPGTADRLFDRVVPALAALVRRAQACGQIRPEVDVTDVGMLSVMLSAVGDVASQRSPQLWRRYFAFWLDGLCSQRRPAGEVAAVPALSEAEFRAAMARHKQDEPC